MTLLNEAGETEQNREQNVLENDGATSGKVPSYCQCTWLKKTPTKALEIGRTSLKIKQKI